MIEDMLWERQGETDAERKRREELERRRWEEE